MSFCLILTLMIAQVGIIIFVAFLLFLNAIWKTQENIYESQNHWPYILKVKLFCYEMSANKGQSQCHIALLGHW